MSDALKRFCPTACVFEELLFQVINFLYSWQVHVPSAASNLSNTHCQSGNMYCTPD